MEKITVHSYDWQTSTNPDTENTIINCWALNKESIPCLLRLENFDAFCYVELPLFLYNSRVDWDGFRAEIMFNNICKILGDEYSPHRYRLEYKEKLYFYKGKNKKYPMLLLCFKNMNSLSHCKTKLSYPLRVYGLRGNNRQDDYAMVAVRVWETHIPLETKLLTLKGCKFSQWFNIEGIKVKGEDKISTLENEYVVDWRTLQPIPEEETLSWLTKPLVFSFDLETYSDNHNALPDPLCAKHVVYMISIVIQRLREPETRKKIVVLYGDAENTNLGELIKVNSEIELIDTFQNLIIQYNPDIITGYNILAYDNPYLHTRLERRLKEWKPIGRLIGKTPKLKKISWSSSAYKNQDFHMIEMDGRITIDLLPLIKRDYKLNLYNLDFVSKHFLGKGKHDIKAKEMFQIYELQKILKSNNVENSEGEKEKEKEKALKEMKRVVDYCIVDSDLVMDLFEKINVWINVIQLSSIMGVTPTQLFTRGTGIRMQSQLYDEAFKNNIVLDEFDFPPFDYKGGFVFTPEPGLYNNIACFDFSSLYPSIMMRYNIDHTTLIHPDNMDFVKDEDCHVIEWEEENEEEEENEREENEREEENEENGEEEKGKSNNKKEENRKSNKKHFKYKFVKEPIGLMPRILKRLVAERNNVRKKQKDVPKDSLAWVVLEQTQLGIKVICNSFYGSCGSSFSNLRLPYAGAAITAKARESTQKMNNYLISQGYNVIYGDSVTGDTPLLLRLTKSNGEKEILWRPISRIRDYLLIWVKNENGKEYCKNFGELEVWSDKGFTKILGVMRHKTQKRIYRITTHTGIVKVTEDHSLLNLHGEEIKPNEVKINDQLLTQELPSLSDSGINISLAWVWGFFYADGSCGVYKCKSGIKYSWALNNLNLDFLTNAKHLLEGYYPNLKFKILNTVDSSGVYKLVPVGKGNCDLVREWRGLFYDPITKYKVIPDILWTACKETRINFFNGYYSGDGDKDILGYRRFDNKGQIGAAQLYFLAKSIGYSVSCNVRSDKLNIYRLTCTKSYQRKPKGCIKKIEDFGITDDYVYDIETENHHFGAGVGQLIVHNTDSVMPDIGITDPKEAWGKAEKICTELTALFEKPMNVELEAIFHTMLSIAKKMYACIYLDRFGQAIDDAEKMKIRGILLARRDNCKFQKNFYKSVCWKVMHNIPFLEVFDFIVEQCLALITRQISINDLTMIKGLGSQYKSKSYMMAIFADEMQKSGNPMTPGERVTYVVVKTNNEIKDNTKLGYKMRTPEIFQEKAESDTPEHLDYLYYLEKTIRNGIEKQLYQIGYKKELAEYRKKYTLSDQQLFFGALEKHISVSSISNVTAYRNLLQNLYIQYSKNISDPIEINNTIIQYILNHEFLSKISKPLYNYYIKRRKGRSKRLSSRIDEEPIMMMVRLMQQKAYVMQELRNFKK